MQTERQSVPEIKDFTDSTTVPVRLKQTNGTGTDLDPKDSLEDADLIHQSSLYTTHGAFPVSTTQVEPLWPDPGMDLFGYHALHRCFGPDGGRQRTGGTYNLQQLHMYRHLWRVRMRCGHKSSRWRRTSHLWHVTSTVSPTVYCHLWPRWTSPFVGHVAVHTNGCP